MRICARIGIRWWVDRKRRLYPEASEVQSNIIMHYASNEKRRSFILPRQRINELWILLLKARLCRGNGALRRSRAGFTPPPLHILTTALRWVAFHSFSNRILVESASSYASHTW